MEQKKKSPTKGQLEMRIKNAVVFIPRDKEAQSIAFVDKGVKLTTTMDYCVVAFGYSQLVYDCFNSAGVSRPYLYTKRVIEIANENLEAITIKDKKGNVVGYSFQKLLEVLKAKENKSEYNIVTYYSWFLFNAFQPMFGIGEDEVSSFLVYEDYLHNIARNAILLSEKTEDMTNKQFLDEMMGNILDFTRDMDVHVLFHKKSDEEVMKENIEAMAATEHEQMMEGQINESKD